MRIAAALLALSLLSARADESTARLLQFLSLRPPPSPSADDAWEPRFDALIHAPENALLAEKAVAVAKEGRFASFERHFLYVGPFRDAAGISRTLFFVDYPSMANPGAGWAAYYLFDEGGLLVQAGALCTGNRIHHLSASVNAEKTEITLRGWFNGAQECDQTLGAKAAGLAICSGHGPDGREEPGFNGFGTPLSPTLSPAAGSGAPSR